MQFSHLTRNICLYTKTRLRYKLYFRTWSFCIQYLTHYSFRQSINHPLLIEPSFTSKIQTFCKLVFLSRFLEMYFTRRRAIDELLIDQLLLHLNATLSSERGSLCILCIHPGLRSTKILSLIDEMFNCFNGLSWSEEHTVLHFTLTQTNLVKPFVVIFLPPLLSIN